MPKKRSSEQGSRMKAAIILIVIAFIAAFIAVGGYYSLQGEQTVYAPVKTSETPAPTGTAAQTPAPTPTPTVTAPPPPTPIPTTAKPTATPPPVPTVTEATPPPTPATTSQPAVQQTAAQPTPAQTQANKASYVSANFQSGDIKGSRITVPQGSSVDVYVVVTGYGSGTLKTEVKKDIIRELGSWGIDTVLTTFQNQIFLNGEQTIKVGTFSANDLSGQNSFRQYFAKVYWNGNVIYDPTDPATRESVQTLPSQVFKLSISTVGFGNSGAPQSELTVTKGSPVKVYALVSSQGATSGAITIEVRKDKVWAEDISVITLTKQVSVNAGQSWQEIGTFYPDESTGYWLREYFARGTTTVGMWEYNPTDPSSRPRVLVS